MRGPLVDVAGLAGELDGPRPPLLLDVRWRLGGPPGHQAYLAGHLPGAVYADLDRDLAGPPGAGGRHPLPDPDDAAAAMRRLGVRSGWPVVVYDDAGGVVAARAWWLLRHLGHADVRLLDGGLAAWVAAGRPVATDDVRPEPGDLPAGGGTLAVLDAAGAARVASEGVLLDVRALERFRGDVEPVDPVAGHVPGARSAPTLANLEDAGRFLPPAALADRFAALGVTPGSRVGVYCGSGVNAAHTVLALELARQAAPELPAAALYAGSWSEWVSDPARPVATGDEPLRRRPTR